MLMQVYLTDNHQNHLGSFFLIAFLKQHLRSNESEVGDCGGGGDYRNCVQLSAFQKSSLDILIILVWKVLMYESRAVILSCCCALEPHVNIKIPSAKARPPEIEY